LFISLATCYGAYIFNALDPLGRVPFYAFVGPSSEVSEGEVEADWNLYFNELLTTRDFSVAIQALNQSNPRTPYMFKTSEEIFNAGIDNWIKKYQDENSKKDKMNNLINMFKEGAKNQNRYPNEMLEQMAMTFINSIPQHAQKIKDYFFKKTDVPFF